MARHSRNRSCFLLPLAVVLIAILLASLSVAVIAQSNTSGTNSATLSTPNSPTFLVAPAITVAGSPSSVAVGDLRGSGQLDLFIRQNLRSADLMDAHCSNHRSLLS